MNPKLRGSAADASVNAMPSDRLLKPCRSLMLPPDFRYEPKCSSPGCGRPATYKVSASWSDGSGWELNNYGLACDDHRISLLTRAQLHRQGLVLADGESVGEVALFEYRVETRDAERHRLPEHGG